MTRHAATLTAAVLAAMVGAVSCSGSPHHRAAPSTTITPATSTTQPDTGPYDWARAASPALAVGGGASSTLGAVLPLSGSSRWIVSGTRLAADGNSTATVWVSPDGNSWNATSLTGPQVNSAAVAATTWHSTTIVVGSVGRGTDRRAAVWTSKAPGAPFVKVAGAQLPVGESVMTSVSGGALGLFAAGTASGRTALWYSSNGRVWTRLNDAERVIATADNPHVTALLVGTEGGVYAAGWERSGAAIVAAVWSSDDGVNWHPVQSAQAAFAGAGAHLITALAPFGTGLIAVGGSRSGSRWTPVSWISPNGDSWSEPSSHFPLGARPQPDASEAIARGLSAVATGLHSASLTAVGGGPTAQRIWRSTDGLHWAEAALPPGAATSDGWDASLVGVAGSTTVVADGDAGQPHLLIRRATAWQEPSANSATFGHAQPIARPVGLVSGTAGLLLAVEVTAPAQALGPNRSSAQFFSSADGTTWTAVAASPVFAGGVIAGLAARAGGFVAVGWTRVGGRAQATAWTSPNGRTWRAAAPLDPRRVAASDLASGVCVDGTLEVAVGRVSQPAGATAARAWVSRDGVHWLVAAIGPPAPPAGPGTSSAMAGCAVGTAGGTVGSSGFDAFGTVQGSGANPGPAFWASARATLWTQQTASPFGAGFPYPAVDVTHSRALWLATAGGDNPDLGPGAGGGQSGLWRSGDGGATWQLLDTTGVPWQGAQAPRIDRVALEGTIPVVAGVVDGRLAVWTGVPTT